jgi:hypothetical protein
MLENVRIVEIVIIVISLLLFTLIVYSFLMKLFWSPRYFKQGSILYSKKYPVDQDFIWPVPIYKLEHRFSRTLGRSIKFKKITETEYFFRASLFKLGLFKRYDSHIHGVLIWDYDSECLEVRVYGKRVSTVTLSIMFIGLLILFILYTDMSLPDIVSNFLFITSLFMLIKLLINFVSRLFYGKGFDELPTTYDEIGEYASKQWTKRLGGN